MRKILAACRVEIASHFNFRCARDNFLQKFNPPSSELPRASHSLPCMARQLPSSELRQGEPRQGEPRQITHSMILHAIHILLSVFVVVDLNFLILPV